MTVIINSPYAGRPTGSTLDLDNATEAALVAQGRAVYSGTSPGPVFAPLTPKEIQDQRDILPATQALVSGADNRVVFASTAFTGATNNATAHLQALIDAASAAFSATAGRVRVVVPPGLWMVDGLYIRSNVHLDMTGATLRKTVDGSALAFGTVCSSTHAIIRTIEILVGGTTYYGNYDNIRITGGTLDTNGKINNAAAICLLNCRSLVVENLTVLRNDTIAFWSILIGGQDIAVNNCRVVGASVVGQDGLHIAHGERISATGGYYESGDDAIAVGMDALGALFDDEGIKGVSLANIQVNASRGCAVKVYYKAPSGGTLRHRVDGVYARGIHGKAGVLRNAGVSFYDHSATNSTDPVRMRNLDVECSLDVGSATHDGVNAFGVLVIAAQDWRVAGTMRITDTTGGATRFALGQIQQSVRGNLFVDCPALPEQGGYLIYNPSTTQYTADNTVGGTLIGSSTQVVAHIVLQDALRTSLVGKFLGIKTAFPAVRFNTSSLVVPTIAARGATFAKAGGATTTVGIDPIAAGRLAYALVTGCDFTGVDLAVPTTWNANVTNYDVRDNRGLNTIISGTTTIGAAATTITVTHGSAIAFPDTTLGLSQIRIAPTNITTNPTKWNVSSAAVTSFAVTLDAVPGGAGATFAWSVDTGKK